MRYVIAAYLLCLSLSLVALQQETATAAVSAQTPSDEAQTLALEQRVNEIRQGFGLPVRQPDSRIRSIVRVWNVADKDNYEPTTLVVDVNRSLRVGQFPTYDAYFAVYKEPGQRSVDEIVATWLDPLVRDWIFGRPYHDYIGCAYWYEAETTWGMCIFAQLWDNGAPVSIATPTATPAPLRLPPMPTSRPLPTSTPIWRR